MVPGLLRCESATHTVPVSQRSSGFGMQTLMAQAAVQAVSDRGALCLPGIELLQQIGDVDKAYDLTPEQLQERIASADALIIRSATQASSAAGPPFHTPGGGMSSAPWWLSPPARDHAIEADNVTCIIPLHSRSWSHIFLKSRSA